MGLRLVWAAQRGKLHRNWTAHRRLDCTGVGTALRRLDCTGGGAAEVGLDCGVAGTGGGAAGVAGVAEVGLDCGVAGVALDCTEAQDGCWPLGLMG